MNEAEAMNVALRVLAAITKRTRPAATDVEALREFLKFSADVPADELARDVIQRVLRLRAEGRKSH